MKKYIRFFIGLLILTLNCGGPRTFVHPESDMGFYKRIGVVSFRNMSPDQFAGQKLTSTFITELLLTKRFEVVEPGEFAKTVLEVLKATSGSESVELSSEQIKAIGEKSGVQGIIQGEVKDFQMTRIGSEDFPLISVSVKLVDVPSGQVVWMCSYTAKGGPKFPIFSFGETRTLGELSQKVSKKIVKAFVAKAF